jgi:hypothetical protein
MGQERFRASLKPSNATRPAGSISLLGGAAIDAGVVRSLPDAFAACASRHRPVELKAGGMTPSLGNVFANSTTWFPHLPPKLPVLCRGELVRMTDPSTCLPRIH